MKLSIVATSLLFFQSQLYFSSACDGHHHHHHEIHEENDRRLEELDLDCGTGAPTLTQRKEAGQAVVQWKTAARQSGRALKDVTHEVPVIFHVLRTDSGGGDVSDSLIDQYMDHLNDHFADSAFSFYKVGVTNRVDNTEWRNCDYNNNWDAKSELHVGGAGDLNVYFCDIQTGSGGWAYFPSGGTAGNFWDGIVLESNYTKYGFPSSYVRRTVLPHEAGHWLGLYHTFQDECDAEYDTDNGYPAEYITYNGDGVTDTPAHLKSSRSCSSVANTCPDNVAGVDPGNDPTDNLMSYARDSCRQVFTDGQRERMLAMYEHYRDNNEPPFSGFTHAPASSPVADEGDDEDEDEDKCSGRLLRASLFNSACGTK